jgi:dephospho-CoA kinase
VAPPRFIGLTGAIAAGKSAVLDAFKRLGAATLSADEVVHELLADAEMTDVLVARWGPEVAPAGEIDRTAVAARVFERPDELRWLESQLHPRVGERVVSWRASLPDSVALAVVEVPLLFESGLDAAFDATVCVVADDAIRAERAGARGTEDLEARSGRQLPQAEKAARADFVLDNDGTREELEAEIAGLLPRLEARAPAG